MKQGLDAKKRWAIIVAGALVVFALAFVWILKSRQQPKEPPGTSWEPSTISSSKESSMAPFDRRNFTMLLCGIDDTLRLTDVIMVAKVNLDEKSAQVLQIPRDSYVGPDYTTGKINAVYGSTTGDGINLLKSEIEDILQLRLDFYTTITLEGFRNIIDNLGGIPIDIPQRINYLPGQVIEPGQQTLTGEQAEWFVRYRAGYASGDLGRISAQELFLRALMKAVKDKGRVEAFKSVTKNYDNISTNLPMIQLLSLANEAFLIENDAISFFVAPGSGVTTGGYAVYSLEAEGLAEILNEHFRPADKEVAASQLDIVTAKPDPVTPPPSSSQRPSSSAPSRTESSSEEEEQYPPLPDEEPPAVQYQYDENSEAAEGQYDFGYIA